MYLRTIAVFASVSFAIMTVSCASGDDITKAKEDDITKAKEEARNVLNGFRFGRERLRSGVVNVNGRRRFLSKKNPLDSESDLSLFIAFEFPDRFRFDRKEQHFDSKVTGIIGGRYARSSEYALVLGLQNPMVSVVRASDPPPRNVRVLDPRVVGLCNLTELESDIGFSKLMDFFDGIDVVSCIGSGGKFDCRWLFANSSVACDITFEQQGDDYLPVHFEQRYGIIADAGREASEVCDVKWQRISEVNVPIWMKIVHREGLTIGPMKSRREYELNFDWTSVNEKVPDDLFTVEGFKQVVAANREALVPRGMIGADEDGTFVVDNRMDKAVLLEKPTKKGVDTTRLESSFGLGRVVVLAINGIVLLVVIFVAIKASRPRSKLKK